MEINLTWGGMDLRIEEYPTWTEYKVLKELSVTTDYLE